MGDPELTPVASGADALVAALVRGGVDTVFGVPGLQLDPLFDSLHRHADRVRVVHTRHEEGAAYLADGYARSSGRTGVCAVVPGPGLLNAGAGLATAYACNSPVLAMVAQVPTDAVGRGVGVLHEVPRQIDILRTVTKSARTAALGEDLGELVWQALRQTRSGRPRPVGLEIPADLLAAPRQLAPAEPATPPPAIETTVLDAAARTLGSASQPVVYAGGGVVAGDASSVLEALVERLGAPVVTSINGLGSIDSRHPLAVGPLGAADLLLAADVVLVVGSRFVEGARIVAGRASTPIVIQLDADPREIGRNLPVAIGIAAGAAEGLQHLLDRLPSSSAERRSLEGALRQLRDRLDDRLAGMQPQAGYGDALRAALPEDGILVNGMTQVAYWNNFGFRVYQPRSFITPSYQATLGFEYPTALGAQVANPDRPVVAVIGDGGFLYTVQELATAVQHGIPAVAVVFNDSAFGNVRRIQRERFEGRYIASSLVNPDFMALAAAFGVEGRRVSGGPGELRVALREALEDRRPALVEVVVGEMPNPGLY